MAAGSSGAGSCSGSKPQVGLLADRVDLGVVVAEPAALEDGGLAAESVCLDVATCHEHERVSFKKCCFSDKVLITSKLALEGAGVTT